MKFYWNSDTLEYFKNNPSKINKFVKYECDLEEGETEEMLIKDLKEQIKNLK
jgi:hypothetical protein